MLSVAWYVSALPNENSVIPAPSARPTDLRHPGHLKHLATMDQRLWTSALCAMPETRDASLHMPYLAAPLRAREIDQLGGGASAHHNAMGQSSRHLYKPQ